MNPLRSPSWHRPLHLTFSTQLTFPSHYYVMLLRPWLLYLFSPKGRRGEGRNSTAGNRRLMFSDVVSNLPTKRRYIRKEFDSVSGLNLLPINYFTNICYYENEQGVSHPLVRRHSPPWLACVANVVLESAPEEKCVSKSRIGRGYRRSGDRSPHFSASL